MSAPLVTIIVPCYNHERFIAECLESIAAQDYLPLQVIVIDDGSSDQSSVLARQLSEHHGFEFYEQNNQGLIATINRGLMLAKGKYYCIFASDDVMTPNRLKRQVGFLEKNPEFSACGGNIQEIDQNSYLIGKPAIHMYRELSFEDILLGLKHGIPAPTAMMRMEAVKKLGGYKLDAGIEDLYMWLKLTSNGYRVVALEDVFARYRKSTTSMHNRTLFMLKHKLRIIDEYRAHPDYREAEDKMVLGSLLRAATSDRAAAKTILSYYKGSWLNLKLLRAVFRWMIAPNRSQFAYRSNASTLIITIYNQARQLKRVLESAVQQSRPALEIIIADDGSSDATEKVIAEFKLKYPAVTLKHIWQEDEGFRKTKIQNKAVSISKGEYLIFIDGDMIMHPRFIEMHMKHGRKNRVLCGYRGLKPNDVLTQNLLSGKSRFSWDWAYLSRHYIFGHINEVTRALIIENKVARNLIASKRKRLSGCNFSLHKEDFCSVNGFDEDITEYGYEDYELGKRLTRAGKEFMDVSRLCVTAHLYHQSRKHNVSEKLKEIEISNKTWCENGLIGKNFSPAKKSLLAE